MHEEQNRDATASVSTANVMHQFVQSVDDGTVRSELTEDCILSFFGRCVKGVMPVVGYIRTQVTGRFRHTDFLDAQPCTASQEAQLKERYARSFQVMRRCQKPSGPIQATMRTRVESDEETEIDVGNCPSQLVTPPRSTASSANSEEVRYIESSGVLETVHDHNDGGIDLGESCQVTLTLGYRSSPIVPNNGCAIEICLVVYEKQRRRTLAHVAVARTSGMQRLPRMRSPRSVHTDDEGEAPAPRSVRRTLFASTEWEDEEDTLESMSPNCEQTSLPALTPRKRHHKRDSSMKCKRERVLGGLRF